MLNAVEKVFINSSRSIFFFLIKLTNAKMISYKIQNINDYGKDVSEIKRASIQKRKEEGLMSVLFINSLDGITDMGDDSFNIWFQFQSHKTLKFSCPKQLVKH